MPLVTLVNNMENRALEIEQMRQQLYELQSMLDKYKKLKGMDDYTTPVEEAYQKVYGKYPFFNIGQELTSENSSDLISWVAFKKGWDAAKESND